VNGLARTGGNAGATTGARLKVEFGQRAATEARQKANGTKVTKVATDPAFNALSGQTAFLDFGFV